jgi:hypothetical protein
MCQLEKCNDCFEADPSSQASSRYALSLHHCGDPTPGKVGTETLGDHCYQLRGWHHGEAQAADVINPVALLLPVGEAGG